VAPFSGSPGETTTSRRASGDDALAIRDVFLAARSRALPWLPDLHTPDDCLRYFADRVLPSAMVWVAELQGGVVGFLALQGDLIEHLYVHPGHWRRRIGRQLLQQARECSPRRLRLFAFERNEPARRFYEAHGFRAVAFGDGSGNEEGHPDVEYVWLAPEPQAEAGPRASIIAGAGGDRSP
jgi:GNAT superfamily N-acetyltransferase